MMARKTNDYVHWTDSLFVPVSFLLSLVLSRWLYRPLATLLSFIAVSFLLFLFEPRDSSPKRFIFAMLVGALVTFLLSLFYWP